jgi:hypothetical protein
VRNAGNSHFSRFLAFWRCFHWNLLPCSPFQLKQTVGFPGFPEKFSGGGIWGGGSMNPNLNPNLNLHPKLELNYENQ